VDAAHQKPDWSEMTSNQVGIVVTISAIILVAVLTHYVHLPPETCH
jgi:hypothetical protein